MQLNSINFNPYDKVEIIRSSNSATSFYPATIIHCESHQTKIRKKRKKNNNNKKQEDGDYDTDDEFSEEDELYLVEYETPQNDIAAFVKSGEIRPEYPELDTENCQNFEKGEKVDVLIDGCWMESEVLGVLYEGSKYMIRIVGDEDDPIEVRRSSLRVHRDWRHGSWNPPPPHHHHHQMEQDAISQQQTSSEVRNDENDKRLKLKLNIQGAKKLSEANFRPGTAVEVRSDEDGYQGSWYSAIVVDAAGVGKFLVEYQTLKTEDELELLKETANEQDIRPCPPEVQQTHRYKEFEEVDAWYNDGWWEGMIYKVLDGWKYIVYFASTHEKLVYQHSNLRPRQNLVDGKWVRTSLFPSSLDMFTTEIKDGDEIGRRRGTA